MGVGQSISDGCASTMLAPKLVATEAANSFGGKGANLATLMAAGLPVPGAVCITSDEYESHVLQAEFAEKINAVLASAEINEEALASIRQDIEAVELSDSVKATIKVMLDHDGGSFAVRSSANTEDGSALSFAGAFESYLNQRGADQVYSAVKRCWASVWTPTVLRYTREAASKQRAAAGDGAEAEAAEPVLMSVVIQHQLDAVAAGVLFTRNPIAGGCDQMVVESVWGQGHALASGEETPYRALLPQDFGTDAAPAGDVISETVETQASMYRFAADGGVEKVPTPDAESGTATASVTRGQLVTLAALGRQAEAALGYGQDIEWCATKDGVYILQSRPITTLAGANGELTRLSFAPPGDGVWTSDSAHFPKSASKLFAECYPAGFSAGFLDQFHRYGNPPMKARMAIVNGFVYIQVGPDFEPPSFGTLIPFIRDTLPKLNAAAARSVEVVNTRLWVEERRTWDDVTNPDCIRRNTDLLAVDLASLDAAGLAAHVRACADNFAHMALMHHRHTNIAVIPSSVLLLKLADWLGEPPASFLPLLAGSSVVSHGLRAETISAIAADDAASALVAEAAAAAAAAAAAGRDGSGGDDGAQEEKGGVGLSWCDDPSVLAARAVASEALDKLLAWPAPDGDASGGGVAAEVAHLLRFEGARLVTTLDPSDPCLREMPEVLLASLAQSVAAERDGAGQASRNAEPDADADADADADGGDGGKRFRPAAGKAATARQVASEAAAAVRARLPSDEARAEFDIALADARGGYHVRDERSLNGDTWGAGVLRCAVLEVGRRAVAAGRLSHAELAPYASVDEAVALALACSGGGDDEAKAVEAGGSPLLAGLDATLRQRLEYRERIPTSQAPASLPVGVPRVAPPPPPLERMNPEQQLLTRAGMLMFQTVFGAESDTHGKAEHPDFPGCIAVRGIAASRGSGDGVIDATAVVVKHAADLTRVKAGQVLVATCATSGVSALTPILAGVVFEFGGELSHPAIVAREVGIPGIVRAADATNLIPDGARVRIFGHDGIMVVLPRDGEGIVAEEKTM